MRLSRWRCAFGAAVVASVVVPAALAWACVGLMALTTSTSTVQPGGKVTVTGRQFAEGVPVEIHLDSPTGRLLGTAPAPTDTMTSKFNLDVTIPADVPTGPHFLVATQQSHYMNSGSPARAALNVGTGAPPASTAPQARAADLTRSSGPSGLTLFLIGLGVALVAVLVAGLITFVTARSSSAS